MVAVGNAPGHERRDDRDPGQLDEARSSLARRGADDAAADVEDRPLGLDMRRLASRICLPCGRVTGR